MPPPTASGRISEKRVERGSRNFTRISGTANLIHLPDITSLAAMGQMQYAIKYCTKVRKTGTVLIEAQNSVPVSGKITSNDTLNLI